MKDKKCVMLIEDNNYLIDLYSLMLDFLGYEPMVCRNGKEAVELFTEKNSTIDVVLLDLILPGISGLDCIDHFKKIKPDIPIIACTSSELINDPEKIKKKGATEVLQKPFRSSMLGMVLNRALN